MADLDTLRSNYEQAEQAAQQIMAEKDQALSQVRDQYQARLQDANDQAAAAQKQLLDAEAVNALLDRPDGQAVAESLVRQGGLADRAVQDAFHTSDD